MLILINILILDMVWDLIHICFLLSDGSWFSKNATMFGADINLFVHVNNKNKDGKSPTQELDNTKLSAEKKYAVNFSKQQKKLV